MSFPKGRVSAGSVSLPCDLLSYDNGAIAQSVLDFITGSQELPQRPSKRQKLTQDQILNVDGTDAKPGASVDMAGSGLDFIVVKRSIWDVVYQGSSSSILGASTNQDQFRTANATLQRKKNDVPETLSFHDVSLQLTLPDNITTSDDIQLALRVHRQCKNWVTGQGRIWTEFGLALEPRKKFVALRISLTVKWNVTSSPDSIVQANRMPRVITDILAKYYPDDRIKNKSNWTAKEFYESVHTPAKTDDVHYMDIPGLEATLYPFQERTVQFLLKSEGVEWSPQGIRERRNSKISDLPISFIAAHDPTNRPFYVSHLFALVTLDPAPFEAIQHELRGGILAEEMGLGKTVEMISLILLNKRNPEDLKQPIFDTFTGTTVRPTAATLIICPPSILEQWISEVKTHAPHLGVMQYEGIKGHLDFQPADLLNQLSVLDVVVTTYSILAEEIYYTQLNGEKSLRAESKYPRPISPLMQLSWFRVCIDEAQMIESGVSNAAQVARLIPRINAWCVSGTPVRKNIKDLQGLLTFLRYEPYDSKRIWASLTSSHKHEFRRLFGSLAIRHSKQSVRDELKLPAQRRYVITMPFTPIEKQHYRELVNQMCEEIGLDTDGSPLTDDWDPDAVTDIMRTWLVRLRQTALHPDVGGQNRQALGLKSGPPRTIDQVLDAMMEKVDLALRTDQRALLLQKLKRGQLFEESPRVKEALAIWTTVKAEASELVKECRDQFQLEVAQVQQEEKSDKSREVSLTDDEFSETEDIEQSSRLGVLRNRLRGALEIEHMAVFFQANAFYQIRDDKTMTKPDSAEFHELHRLETDAYERAKNLRLEILQDIYRKVDRLMDNLSKGKTTHDLVQVPAFRTNIPTESLESRHILQQLETLAIVLDEQGNIIDELRDKAIGFLLRPLVDDDQDGHVVTGDEYGNSTATQDEVFVYVQALRVIIADRSDALSGLDNMLIAYDVKVALREAGKDRGPLPSKTIELFKLRDGIKPTKDMGSIRGIISSLARLATTLKTEAKRSKTAAKQELKIVEDKIKSTQKQLSEHTKIIRALEKELDLLTSLMNCRLEYYRQLQAISDMVDPYKGQKDEKTIKKTNMKMMENENKISQKIADSHSKRRYLIHLRQESAKPQELRICPICGDELETASLTICGHQFCKECIVHWLRNSHNCPVCKKRLKPTDLQDVTYKPQKLAIQIEDVHDPTQERVSSTKSRKSAIYSEISAAKLAEIRNTELEGPSFTTKVDTLARHLIWLREHEPGAKSVIFSQFKDFLDVLARAFAQYKIGFSSIDKPQGIQKFKEDPSIECFLLHARAHSSGLNLVIASHVFLCEPLLHTALELQAIARVDRIGQQRKTSVWLYLIRETVEESIYQLSVKRRMDHIGQTVDKGKGKGRELSPAELADAKLEEANSMELQQVSLPGLLAKGDRGGEMVQKEDLWNCLFGGSGSDRVVRTLEGSDLGSDPEVARELRAGAAEEREDNNA